MRWSPSSDSSPGASQFAQRLQCQVKTAECLSNAGWPDSRVRGLQYCLQIALSPTRHPEKPMKWLPGKANADVLKLGRIASACSYLRRRKLAKNNNNQKITITIKIPILSFLPLRGQTSARRSAPLPTPLSFYFVILVLFGLVPLWWGKMMLKKYKWAGRTTSLCLFDDTRWPLCLFKVLSKFLERVEFPTHAQ